MVLEIAAAGFPFFFASLAYDAAAAVSADAGLRPLQTADFVRNNAVYFDTVLRFTFPIAVAILITYFCEKLNSIL